jgi:pyruvate,water dikinase
LSALKLETHYQWPQDIEWSVDDSGILYIVQSRPIVKHPVTTDSGPMITWSNANVRENFPDPISPLLYSVASAGYSNYFRNLGLAFGISRQRIEAMEGPLTNIIGVHGARIYYNLSSIHSVIRMAPFGDWLIKYFNSFVGATETPPPLAGDRMFKDLARNRGVQLLETIRIIVKTGWQFLFIGRRITRFESRIDHFAESTRPALLENLDLVQLRDALRAFMEIRLNRWTEASLADTAAMICYGILNSLLKTTFRDDSHGVLANNLLKGVTGLVSSEPVFELWKLSRIILQDEDLRRMFEQQSNDELVNAIRNPGASANLAKFSSTFDEYLENWGFRCSGELMLTVPSFQENPAGLIQIIKTYMDVKGESPVEILQQQQSARKRQTIEALAQISCDRKLSPLGRLRTKLLIRLFLKWTQDAIGMRERARLKQALLYSRLRRVLLCIGNSMSDKNLLAHADDIFFLTYQEIDQLASSRAMFPDASTELVEMRREEFERLSAMDMPDSFVMEEGTYLYPNNIGIDSDTDFIDANIDYLEGTTACGGKIKGRATVLKDVTQADQLDAGDILITTQTDPGWGHVFFLIKGLIIERGGMLSHGAILAREFGIPAVVGVRNATERIPQHATVVLDTDEGKIYVSR